MIHTTKNGIMKGGSVVLERHEFNAKELVVETKNSKTFTDLGQKVLEANRLAIPNSLHGGATFADAKSCNRFREEKHSPPNGRGGWIDRTVQNCRLNKFSIRNIYFFYSEKI